MKLTEQQNERGSVMLETILVLPVYLMFIAMTFFVGELSLYRNLLLQLDHYDLWAAGSCSGAANRKDIVSFMFGKDIGDGNTAFSGFSLKEHSKSIPEYSTNRWWQRNTLQNEGIMTIPVWIDGIRFLNTKNSSTRGSGRNNYSLYGSQEAQKHFSRSDSNPWRGGDDYKEGKNLCSRDNPMWGTIVNENFCGFETGGNIDSQKISSISEYPRDGFDIDGDGCSIYAVFSGEQQ